MDYFAERNNAKKERVAKNQLQQLKNVKRRLQEVNVLVKQPASLLHQNNLDALTHFQFERLGAEKSERRPPTKKI